MKSKISSRGSQVDTEQCVANVGTSKYDLILIATIRAREIRRQNKDSEKFEHIHPIVTALLEIQDGKIDKEYLKRIK
jgi:DNA-directed RNA polymerase omega subunit